MSSSGHIRFERGVASSAIAHVTISNPGRLNALTRAMWRELRAIFDGLSEREAEVRAIVVRGEQGHFAAGADLEEFRHFHFEPAQARAFHEAEPAPALHAMLACDIPLIAQIDGVCIGGGLEIAACCDIRIAGHSSRFGAPIAKLGFPMAPDELAIMVAVAGRATMAELLLEARLYDAATALERGLVHRVVDDAGVSAEAHASAERIAALPPLTARINKQTLRQLAAHASQGRFDEAERAAHYRYASSDEHREGIAAFLKRS
jgi:enoyl-CoA hydratase/carnithine racemase